jgi:hypothetical protein
MTPLIYGERWRFSYPLQGLGSELTVHSLISRAHERSIAGSGRPGRTFPPTTLVSPPGSKSVLLDQPENAPSRIAEPRCDALKRIDQRGTSDRDGPRLF